VFKYYNIQVIIQMKRNDFSQRNSNPEAAPQFFMNKKSEKKKFSCEQNSSRDATLEI
jgi:hypothetical protein